MFSSCGLVTSVWRFQVRLKMLVEAALALTYFHLRMTEQAVMNEGLLIWHEHQLSVVIMTQTICTHPPVQPATYLEIVPAEEIPVADEGLTEGTPIRQGFVGFWNEFSSFNTAIDWEYLLLSSKGEPSWFLSFTVSHSNLQTAITAFQSASRWLLTTPNFISSV